MEKTCSVDGCERPTRTRKADICNAHYFRLYRYGDTGPAEVSDRKRKPCAGQGCDRPAHGLGYCDLHYQRLRSHGDVETVKRTPIRRGEQSTTWRGDDVGYWGAHTRARNAHGPASEHLCVECLGPADQWAYDHEDPNEKHDKHGTYSTSIDHYMPMCYRCHKRFDYDHARASCASEARHGPCGR